jgi:hypothetical protein
MSDLLQDYKLKRRRAMQHFHALRESVDRFTNIERKPIPGNFDRDASKYFFDVPLESIDPDWTLLLGDFAYDTRASLDYLITALIRSTGKQEHERSEFPIYSIDRIGWQDIDEWWEKGCGGKLKGQLQDTPSGTKAALKPLQPFYRVPASNPWQHPLWVLYLLSNRDKHRRLNLLVHRAVADFVDAARQPIFHGPAPHFRISEAYEGDPYAVTLARDQEFGMDVYLLPAYDIRLHEPPHLIGNVIDTLAGINEFINSRVLPTVQALL